MDSISSDKSASVGGKNFRAADSCQANPYQEKKAAYYALGLLTVVYVFNFIDRQLLAILQESIKADLGLSDSQLGLMTGFAFAAFYVTLGIPIARLADLYNRRNIISIALFFWSFLTILNGMAQNFIQLLLARIGVGVGEAGASPPSHSIISDIFPPENRAGAIAIYSTGINIGVMLGFFFGGWINEFFGWRMAFLVCGVPGILLAFIVRKTLAEPLRGATSKLSKGSNSSESESAVDQPAPFTEVIKLLWNRRSFRFMALASGLNGFAAYSAANWSASFMIRSHGMSSGEVGTWLAMIFGLGGAIGVLGGGFLADRLALKDRRWYMWLPAIAILISVPFSAAVYLVSNKYMALLLYLPPTMFSAVFMGTTVAAAHALVGSRMRAITSALLYFVMNFVGLGAGPWVIGMLSDSLAPTMGIESLRYAMLMAVPLVTLLAALCFYLASRPLPADLVKARAG